MKLPRELLLAIALAACSEDPGPPCAVRALSAGDAHTCALLSSGGVRCWGFNGDGQLGDGTFSDRALPPASDVLGEVRAIATGAYHTCVVSRAGGVRCWGANDFGQLGDGTLTTRLTPPEVDLDLDLLGGARAVATGFGHSCAITTGGAVRCWGGSDAEGNPRPGPPTADLLAGVASPGRAACPAGGATNTASSATAPRPIACHRRRSPSARLAEDRQRFTVGGRSHAWQGAGARRWRSCSRWTAPASMS